ncbi:MAG TPA: hypothetical protein VMW38_08380, partial [Terriglobia bacterium]|nr:hypothetical protein [Terriglobia bacterium]
MANSTTDLAVGLGKLLSLLQEAFQGSATTKAFVNFLGWDLPPGLEEIGLAGVDLTVFLEKLEIVLESTEDEWGDEILMASRIADLAIAMSNLVEEIQHFSQELPTQLAQYGDYVSRTKIH